MIPRHNLIREILIGIKRKPIEALLQTTLVILDNQ